MMRLPHVYFAHLANGKNKQTPIYSNGDYLTQSLAEQLVNAGLWRMGITEHPPSNDAWRSKIKSIVQRWPNHFGLQKIPPTEMVNHGGSVKSIAPKGGPCRVAGSVFACRWDGRVTICCNDLRGDIVIGNVYKQTMTEVYDAPDFTKLRKELRSGVRSLQICQQCRTCE